MPSGKLMLATICACLACGGTGARAQSPAVVQPPAAVYGTYDGTYVGVDLGGAFGSSRKHFAVGATTGDFGIGGVVGGVDAGYSRAWGRLVIGIEGDMSGSGVGGAAHAPNPAYTYETSNHWLGTLRPRLGYLIGGSTLPYVTGGLAFGDIQVRSYRTATGTGGVDDTRVEPGWTLGAGVETGLFASPWRLRVEYLYVRLSDADVPSEIGRPTQTSFAEHIFRIGLNYAF